MTITNGYATLAEVKERLLDAHTYTAATISFNASTKTISDTAKGLDRFNTGAYIKVSGSTSNDGYYTIATGSTPGSIVTSEALPLTEIAGDTVTITDYSDLTDDATIEQVIEAASRIIDGKVSGERVFYDSTGTRIFDVPKGTRELKLDQDLVSVTTLTNGDGTVLTTSDYYLWPRNTSPKRKIILKESSTYSWTWDSSGNTEGAISVAGTWGWAATVPADVAEACRLLAIKYFKRKDAPFGVVGSVDMGQLRQIADEDPDVIAALKHYKRRL